MKLPEVLARLAARRRLGVELGLSRMRRLLAALGDPLAGLDVVHIAGTNGKGSTAKLVASALTAGGLRTGLYTSPHVQRVNERIQIDGVAIDDELFARRLAEVLALDDEATFFEVVTALAFFHFGRLHGGRAGLDIAVVETGLGGRLDATNVVHPRVTVLTPMGFDHRELLGDTLAAIAREKAGILKADVPCVVAHGEEEVVTAIREVAARRGVELIVEGKDFSWKGARGRLLYSSSGRVLAPIEVGLKGAYQLQNAAIAWATLDLLARQGVVVDETSRRRGFAAARWPGRYEELGGILLDGAHNPSGCRALARTLPPGTRFSLIFAALEGKEIEAMFDALRPHVGRVVFTALANDRAVDPSRLASTWGPGAEIASSPQEALARLRQGSSPLLVTGSLYLVGELRALLLDRTVPDLGDPAVTEDRGR